MRPLSRRGSTLMELLLACTVAVTLAGLASTVIIAAARSARRQGMALDQQRSLAAVAAWWRADLRDSEAGDVEVAAPDRLLTRHPVGSGAPCRVSGSDLWVAQSAWRAERDPEPGRDLLWLLTDAVASTWVEQVLTAVGRSSCPDGAAALKLTVGTAVPTVLLVRALEPLVLRHYRSGSSWWFGLAPGDGSAVVQPFAGPFDPAGSRFAMESSGVHVFVQPAGGSLREYLGPLPPP